MTAVSVIICAHNPRADYLQRVLEALRAQTLPKERWELLVIDNASSEPLGGQWDLSWHPNARHIREDDLGLTSARLCGIAEARSDLLLFVDDDNVLDRDYLESALEIGCNHPFLGAWGGTIHGEFEAEPPAWAISFFTREYRKPSWSNLEDEWRALPWGAGLCVRAMVAKGYAKRVSAQPVRRRLGRIGSQLSSCDDNDLVETSCEFGLGFGGFPDLQLVHLIPKERVQPDYLFSIRREHVSSHIFFRYLQSGALPPKPGLLKITARFVLILMSQGWDRARLYLSTQSGARAGIGIAERVLLQPDLRGIGESFENRAPPAASGKIKNPSRAAAR